MFTDTGSLSRDSVFNVVPWGVGKVSNSLIGWLKQMERGHTVNEFALVKCRGRDSKVQGDKNVRVYLSLKTYSPTVEQSKRHALSTTMRNKDNPHTNEELCDGSPFMLVLTVQTEVTQLRNPKAMQLEQLDPGVAAAKCSTPGQMQGGHGYQHGRQSQSSDHNSPTRTDLWHWRIKHGVSRSELGSLLNSYLICISRKVLGQMNNSLT